MTGQLPDTGRDFREIRVVGLMVVGPDEGTRWLDCALSHARRHVDEMFVFLDDGLRGVVDQATLSVLKAHTDAGVTVAERAAIPSFLEHEGRFRQGAWQWLTGAADLRSGDWVYLPDADEVFVSRWRTVSPYDALHASAGFAEVNGHIAVEVAIPEVFGQTGGGHPLVRTDGAWGSFRRPRLVAWQPGATYRDRPMGCGSAPEVYEDAAKGIAFGDLLHYGYATPEDTEARWERYSSLPDHGHASDHIASIRTPPHVETYPGDVIPDMWRGQR